MKKRAQEKTDGKEHAQLALGLELELHSPLPRDLAVTGNRAPGDASRPVLSAGDVHPPAETSPAEDTAREPRALRRARARRQLGLDVGEKRGRHSWAGDRCQWCGLRRVRSLWLAGGVHVRGLFYLVTHGTIATAVRPSCGGRPLEHDDDAPETSGRPGPGVSPGGSGAAPPRVASTSTRSRGVFGDELARLDEARARAARGGK